MAKRPFQLFTLGDDNEDRLLNMLNPGTAYVFSQDDKVSGVGQFVARNRVDGQYYFVVDAPVKEGEHRLIINAVLNLTFRTDGKVCDIDRFDASEVFNKAMIIDPSDKAELYYIWNGEYVGNAMLWWGPDGGGYTCNIERAGKYTLEDALRINKSRGTDIPFPVSHIDAILTKIVDAQNLHHFRGIHPANASPEKNHIIRDLGAEVYLGRISEHSYEWQNSRDNAMRFTVVEAIGQVQELRRRRPDEEFDILYHSAPSDVAQ